mgnify:CR=1 FL=1
MYRVDFDIKNKDQVFRIMTLSIDDLWISRPMLLFCR